MPGLRLALLVATLFALPGEASADDGLNFRFGSSGEAGGALQASPLEYTPGGLFLMMNATLGIPLTGSFEIVTGGFVGMGATEVRAVDGLGGGRKGSGPAGLLGLGAGGALRMGDWRFSALAAVVASRLDSREGFKVPPVGPGLRAEISRTWWPSTHLGVGFSAHGTLAGVTPLDTMIPIGTVGVGYHFAFR